MLYRRSHDFFLKSPATPKLLFGQALKNSTVCVYLKLRIKVNKSIPIISDCF